MARTIITYRYGTRLTMNNAKNNSNAVPYMTSANYAVNYLAEEEKFIIVDRNGKMINDIKYKIAADAINDAEIITYKYCLNQNTCIHRRGCKRWVGNNSDKFADEESNKNIFGYIDDEDCMRNDEVPFNMIDRFRYSDGSEMKK